MISIEKKSEKIAKLLLETWSFQFKVEMLQHKKRLLHYAVFHRSCKMDKNIRKYRKQSKMFKILSYVCVLIHLKSV